MGELRIKRIVLEGLIQGVEEELVLCNKRLSYWVWLRVISFIAIWLWCYLFFGQSWLMWSGMLIFAVSFLYFVKTNARDAKIKMFLDQKLLVLRNEIQSDNGLVDAFPTGVEFQNSEHAFSSDLDLFGSDSLFRRICRPIASPARRILANWLLNGFDSPQQWQQRKNDLREWRDAVDLRINLLALSALHPTDEDSIDRLKSVAQTPAYFSRLWLSVVCIVLPIWSIAGIIAYFFDALSLNSLLLALLLPLSVIGIVLKKINRSYGEWSEFLVVLSNYREELELILLHDWKEEGNRKRKEEASGAEEALTELQSIFSAFDQRNNMFLGVLLNAVFAWDFQQVRRLERWKRSHGVDLSSWIEALMASECYASASAYLWMQEDQLTDVAIHTSGGFKLRLEGSVHPFMQRSKAVANSVSFEEGDGVMIITGANMAGKSTFLRSLGVNIVLAFALGSAHAREMELSEFRLFSSMRTSDSVQKGESYFFNELARLKLLVEEQYCGKPLFVLLDEILKGTNSEDKAKGSKLFVEKLLEDGIRGVIATHDLSLCMLEQLYPEKINNRSFEVEIKDHGLYFDYTLRTGICRTMNASYLLKSMGLTPENSKL